MQDRAIRRLAAAGVLAAAIMLLTMFVSIPMPGGHGYINLGDAGVLLAAYALGGGWGFLCAGLASALSDVLLGWSVYAPATFLIKGCVALLAGACFSRCRKKGRSFFVYPAALIVPVGYFVYESILYGRMAAAVNVPLNLVQCLAGAGVAQGLIAALSKRRGLSAFLHHAPEERARLVRDPRGGGEVALIAADEPLALHAADILSVQGVTARVLIVDAQARQPLSELLPAGVPAVWRREGASAEDFAKQALEAWKA